MRGWKQTAMREEISFNNQILFDLLLEKYELHAAKTDTAFALEDVQILTGEEDDLQSHRIYLTKERPLFETTAVPDSLLVLVQAKAWQDRDLDSGRCVICTSDSLPAVRDVIAEAMRKYNDWKFACYEALTDGAPIESLMQVIAGMLRNPISLLDTSLVMISYAGRFEKDITGTIWEKTLHLGFPPMEFYTRAEQAELAEKLALEKTESVILHPTNDPAHTYVAFPIRLDGHILGMAAIMDLNAPITPGEYAIAKQAAIFGGKYLRGSMARLHESRNTYYYVIRLLQGEEVDPRILDHYLTVLHWKQTDAFLLFHFPFSEKRGKGENSFSVRSQFSRIERAFPESITVEYENAAVLIMHLSAGEKNQALAKVSSFVRETKLVCAASDVFYNFHDLKYAYIQSKIALRFACTDPEKPALSCFPVEYSRYLLSVLDRGTSLRALCHPMILRLYEQGTEQDQTLIHDLGIYLKTGCSIQETADLLFVHRNTLVYRLGKISHLLDLDLRSLDLDTRFYLLFSCMICEYLQQ